MTVPIPVRASVRDLLRDLLQRPVTVTEGTAQTLDPGRPAHAAVFSYDAGAAAAVCVCDAALAGGAGAAIAMLPAEDAAAVQRGEGPLEGDLLEFFREVVNVFGKLLNSPTTPHVLLRDLHPLPGAVPADVAQVVTGPGARVDYAVAIEGYGQGTLTLLGGHGAS